MDGFSHVQRLHSEKENYKAQALQRLWAVLLPEMPGPATRDVGQKPESDWPVTLIDIVGWARTWPIADEVCAMWKSERDAPKIAGSKQLRELKKIQMKRDLKIKIKMNTRVANWKICASILATRRMKNKNTRTPGQQMHTEVMERFTGNRVFIQKSHFILHVFNDQLLNYIHISQCPVHFKQSVSQLNFICILV